MNNLLKLLKENQPVFLDSSCFIYLLENNVKYADEMNVVFDKISVGEINSITSIITLSEILVKPFQNNNESLISEYEDFFEHLPNFNLLRPDFESAINAAKIRAKYKFSLTDSYQLAVSIESGCKSFLTNDKNLKKYKEVKVLILEDFIK